MSKFDFSDLLNITTDVEKAVAGIKKQEMAAVKLAANEYASDVKKDIPYQSGTLRRSIHVETEMEGLKPIALVGTDVPYARRLEYGFIGEDSLGRVYHQMPKPIWRATFDNNIRKYERMMAEKLGEG